MCREAISVKTENVMEDQELISFNTSEQCINFPCYFPSPIKKNPESISQCHHNCQRSKTLKLYPSIKTHFYLFKTIVSNY